MFVSFIRKGKQCQQPCRYLVRSHSVVSTAHLPLWSLGLCHLLGLQGPCGLSQLPSSGQPISILRGRTNPTDPIHACQTYLSHHHHFSEAESDLVLNTAVKQKINTRSKMLELLLQGVSKQNDVFKDKTVFGQPARNSRGNIRLSFPRDQLLTHSSPSVQNQRDVWIHFPMSLLKRVQKQGPDCESQRPRPMGNPGRQKQAVFRRASTCVVAAQTLRTAGTLEGVADVYKT